MFPYRVKYADSESDIQNNNLLYKINQKHQNTFKKKRSFRYKKSIFFKKFDFKEISVLWRFVWPAFGGPKTLIYIYIYIYIYFYLLGFAGNHCLNCFRFVQVIKS